MIIEEKYNEYNSIVYRKQKISSQEIYLEEWYSYNELNELICYKNNFGKVEFFNYYSE